MCWVRIEGGGLFLERLCVRIVMVGSVVFVFSPLFGLLSLVLAVAVDGRKQR